jgi:hypothetical protein
VRKIQNDYTISFKTNIYQLHEGWPTIFRKEQVQVEERMNGDIVITQRNRIIPYTRVPERPKKGYTLPLPPRKSEEPKQTYFEKTWKCHPWMKHFTYSHTNIKKAEQKQKEELVAPQLTPP